MTDAPLTATVIGLDKLIDNLDDLNGPPLAELLTRASNHAQDVAVKKLNANTFGVPVQTQVRSQSARVFSVMAEARTQSIEAGRAPGEPLVHTGVLAKWIKSVGFDRSPFVLARAIRRRGVKGRFFMRAAIQSTNNVLPGMIRDMANGVTKRFSRK